ncbi:hypothetical protein QM325_02645 [Pseudomonas putida]|uniref:hypothetical protein n=1 Tax=Pseudomonas guariconensis TaxID=1288410 RepID=UPI0024BCEA8B|nr:hypothetical protein [Pseudomonas putida]
MKISSSDDWLNPARQAAYQALSEKHAYYYPKTPRKRRAFVTTEGVSRAVFLGAYTHGYTPSQIRSIWRTVGDHFSATAVADEFDTLLAEADVEALFSNGYCVTGGPIALKHGRKCVAIRILAELLHMKIKTQRACAAQSSPLKKPPTWLDFTQTLLGLVVKADLATEILTSDYLATDLGL